jgi:hypothetical protein
VLVSVQDHVLQSPQTKRPQVADLIWSPIVVKIVFVCAFVFDGQVDVTLFGLFVENC